MEIRFHLVYGGQDMMHKILHEAQGKGECKYHVKWRNAIILKEHLAIFKKDGDESKSHRPFSGDNYAGLTNKEH